MHRRQARHRGLVAAAAATCLLTSLVAPAAVAQEDAPTPTDTPLQTAAASVAPTSTPTPTSAPPASTPTPTPQPTTPPAPEPPPPPPPSPTPTPKPPPAPEPAPEPPPASSPLPAPPPDEDEPKAPKATKKTAKEATAPGLEPPPTELDLVPALEQDTPQPDTLPDDFNRQLEETAAAVAAAQDALASAEAQLAAAKDRLAETEQARKAAAVVRDEASAAAATAALAEKQAERDLASRVASLEDQRDVLGALASEAYRSGGPLSSLSVVLASTTPEEFAASLRGVEAVLRSEDVVIAGLVAELADLAESEARLQAAREERERAEDVAERALELATQAAKTARLVARETELLVERRIDALDAANAARSADLAEYRSLLAASQAVGSSLTGWAEALESLGLVQGSGDWVRPATGALTSRFGPRLHPILGYVKLHTGSDYGVGDGAIYAADDGTVVLAGYNTAYGNMTVISHGMVGGSVVSTLYAHQARILVAPGDTVRKADLIGIIGSTGYSTGPHLHFEIRVDGTPVDPEAWLLGAPTPQEYLSSAAARSSASR